MFTGIVERIGTVASIETYDDSSSGGNGFSIIVKDAAPILTDCHIGDSIAVNGICLTVTEFDNDSFKIGVAPETLQRTNMQQLKVGSKVNLERAIAGHTRFGGHFVQGHIDTVATIVSVEQDANSLRFTFSPSNPDVMIYIVEKGFIAIDGTSLTVTSVDDDANTFSVMLIAHTQENVALASKKKGDAVNIEVDLLGKLVEKQVNALAKARLGSK